jgi:hypothetical protein
LVNGSASSFNPTTGLLTIAIDSYSAPQIPGPPGVAGLMGPAGPSGVTTFTIAGLPNALLVSDLDEFSITTEGSYYDSVAQILWIKDNITRGHFVTSGTLYDAITSPDNSVTITNNQSTNLLELKTIAGNFSSPNNTILISNANGLIKIDVNQNMMASQSWVSANYVTNGQFNGQIQDLQNQIDNLAQNLQELDDNCCEY